MQSDTNQLIPAYFGAIDTTKGNSVVEFCIRSQIPYQLIPANNGTMEVTVRQGVKMMDFTGKKLHHSFYWKIHKFQIAMRPFKAKVDALIAILVKSINLTILSVLSSTLNTSLDSSNNPIVLQSLL